MMKQHVLVELDQFIKAVTADREAKVNLTSIALIRTSLHLLEDLPAAREIIFDYFAIIYDLAVQSYVANANVDPQTGLPPPPPKLAAGLTQAPPPPVEDDSYVMIQEALENLVYKGPPAWAPIIASWSLHLAGKLADKNTKRKMTIMVACNYWLNSGAMLGLLSLISGCFRKMSNAEAESCVETLLSTFERYSMTFDWIVARLGGCFPLKIISQILYCSLKRFVEEPRCHFDSEIGILDYLAFAHEQELRLAFRELLKEGFQPKKTLDASIIPFLLIICNYSEVLLQNLVNVFLEMYNEELLVVLAQKAPLWMSNKAFADMQPSLNNIALRLENNGVKLLIAVSKLAEQYSWCQDFLEFSLQELEQIILNARICPIMNDLATQQSKYLLWKSCLSTNLYEQQTAVRLLLVVSTQHFHIYHQTLSELLRMSYTSNQTGIGAVLRIIGGQSGIVEFPVIKPGLEMVLTDVLLEEQFQQHRYQVATDTPMSINTFKNLVTLAKLEKKNFLPFMKQQSLIGSLNECLPTILQILEVILTKLILRMDKDAAKRSAEKLEAMQTNNNNTIPMEDEEGPLSSKRRKIEMDDESDVLRMDTDDVGDDGEEEGEIHNISVLDEELAEEEKLHKDRTCLAHTIIELFNAIDVGSKQNVLSTADVLKLSILTVKYFFISLVEKERTLRVTAVNRALKLLQRQCSARKAARTACIRELVEGALFYYGYLFGQYEEPVEDDLEIPENELVIVQNQRQTQGPNANRTVLHAGVIGRGLRSENNGGGGEMLKCEPEMQTLLLKALDACCEDLDKQNIIEGYSMISLLLVEMVSTDVMYNGLPFPDEEFTKVTMERDLQIRRSFVNSPILWGLLGFIATHRPALCFSSVLLRALCATCLHQWRARNVNKYHTPNPDDELMQCTRKLLQVMAMGQLLPPPLSNLHMIIEYFEAPEISLLLKECVWNYMKDHVPSPALFHIDNNGLHWRNASLAKIPPQYVDTLRNIMQKKLPKLGQHYHQMFIMCEMNASSNAKPTANDDAKNGEVVHMILD